MGDYGTQEHRQTTTTKTTVTTVGVSLEPMEIDTAYLSTKPGILKIVQIVLSLITFICSVSGCSFHPNASWTAFVSCSAFIVCIVLLFLTMFQVQQQYPRLSWNVFELLYYALWTIFYFIAGACMAALTTYYNCRSSAGAASFFAFATMVAFGLDTLLKFQVWRSNTNRTTLPSTGARNMPVSGAASGNPVTAAPNHPVP